MSKTESTPEAISRKEPTKRGSSAKSLRFVAMGLESILFHAAFF